MLGKKLAAVRRWRVGEMARWKADTKSDYLRWVPSPRRAVLVVVLSG